MLSSHSIEIDATPEQVFAWIDDGDRIMQWVPNLVLNEDLETTHDKVGSTFRQVFNENGREMEFHGVVTGYDVNRQLTIEMDGSGFMMFMDYRLEDLGSSTRLTQDAEIVFKGFFKLFGPLLALVMRKSSQCKLEETFQKLKELVENESSTIAGI